MFLRKPTCTSTEICSDSIEKLKNIFTDCDSVVIGAGAGLSAHRNIEFQEWIEKSKYCIHSIITNDNFSEEFNYYSNIINRRFNDIDNQIILIKDKLNKNNLPTDIEIIFAPNLLQSKYLADYVLVDNKLYVIATEFKSKEQ